ncbi:uncharacterized protein ACIBXB_006082 [Morphnus guianensis]
MRSLERKIEIMLAQAKRPPSITQIRNLITGMDPEDWDGDIWGDSDENSSEEVEELEEREVRPLIKTERHTGPHGGSPRTTIRTTPWSGPKLSKLQAKFSRKPGETETEYLWRISLTGEYQILLSDDEARNYWGPGVFLSAGPPGDQSITSRVVYWAGGVDPKEGGDSFTIQVKGLSELTEGSRKVRPAGCKPRPERSRTCGRSGRNYDPGRDDLWWKAPALGAPRAVLHGQSADDIRELVELLEGKAREQREAPAAPPPREEKRSPFAALREELEGLKN